MAEKVDMVNTPPHYLRGKIEVITAMELLGTPVQWLSHSLKYLCRAAHKGKEVEDLQKALFYMNRANATRAEWGKHLAPHQRKEISNALVAGIPFDVSDASLRGLRHASMMAVRTICEEGDSSIAAAGRLSDALQVYLAAEAAK